MGCNASRRSRDCFRVRGGDGDGDGDGDVRGDRVTGFAIPDGRNAGLGEAASARPLPAPAEALVACRPRLFGVDACRDGGVHIRASARAFSRSGQGTNLVRRERKAKRVWGILCGRNNTHRRARTSDPLALDKYSCSVLHYKLALGGNVLGAPYFPPSMPSF